MKLFGLAVVTTVLVNGQDEDLVDKVKDAIAIGDNTELKEAVYQLTSDYQSCYSDAIFLYDNNEALRTSHDAYAESMTLETDSSKTVESSETSSTTTFSGDELAKYKEECNKIEGTIFFSLPDTTMSCVYDEGSDMTTVVNYGECYPDSESCKSLDEKDDALNEGVLKILWDRGYKCTFDGSDWDSGEDVSSSSENPWGDDESSTGATPMKMLSIAVTAVVGFMMVR